jgi:hypothetical protein
MKNAFGIVVALVSLLSLLSLLSNSNILREKAKCLDNNDNAEILSPAICRLRFVAGQTSGTTLAKRKKHANLTV